MAQTQSWNSIQTPAAAPKELHFAHIVQHMQVGLYVYRLADPEKPEAMVLLHANPASVKLTGIKSEECEGRTISELFPGLVEKGVAQSFAEVVRTGQPQTQSDFTFGSDRIPTKVWSFKAFPLPDDCVGVTFEDITSRKRAEAQVLQQMHQLEALRNIDLAIMGSLDLRVTLNVVLDQVAHTLGADAAAVLLIDPELQTLKFTAGRGFRGTGISQSETRVGEGYSGRAAMQREIVHILDLKGADKFSRLHLLEGEELVTYYGTSLSSKGRIKGVLELYFRSRFEADPEWLKFLEALAGQAAIAIDNAHLFDDLQNANAELRVAYDKTLEGWVAALDLRHKETEGHSRRVAELAVKLAQGIGLKKSELLWVRRGALLHDVGKLGIPDEILLKTGPLDESEWEIMRQHPVYAFEWLSTIPYLRRALDIPYCHHEKWDGSGYPRGLKGSEIPLSARVFAVVDVWDALSFDRPYRPAWPQERVVQHIRSESGKHFDPEVAEVFLEKIAPVS